jgi:hypothetical protein
VVIFALAAKSKFNVWKKEHHPPVILVVGLLSILEKLEVGECQQQLIIIVPI